MICSDIAYFDYVTTQLRNFFKSRNFIEVHPQSRLSILAACEDPQTIATFNYAGNVWPLPQTGQMWLEHDLLKNPELPGLFCVSTSYRNEPRPIPGRHDLIFPMFEFETHGDMQTLYALEQDMLEWLGFGLRDHFKESDYTAVAKYYNVDEIDSDHETKIWNDFGPVFFLKHFPRYTSPFWNMKKEGQNLSRKIDVILYGMETIGSAERSTNKDEMREEFHTISNGLYADLLYSQFGKDRVERELEEFLSLDFFPRSGGGIGITRMIRALKFATQEGHFIGAVRTKGDSLLLS